MGVKKITLFVNLALIVVGVIFLICGLAQPWHTLKIEDRLGTSTCDITLTEMKSKSPITSDTTKLKDLCKDDTAYPDKNPFCKLKKGSDTVISLTTFGLIALVVAGVIAVITLFTQITKKAPAVFKFTYMGTSIAAFVLVLISFIVYNTSDDGLKDLESIFGKPFKFGSGWILYLIAMIISFATLLLGLSSIVVKD